jgi:hypothetical protein
MIAKVADVAQAIRDAISEKIQRNIPDLIPKPKKIDCPFK